MIVPPPPSDTPAAPPATDSLLARAGETVANMPSNLINDMMRLAFRVGARTPDQTEAVEAPKPFDIKPAQRWQETGVDVLGMVAEAVPWFMTGAGAGESVAKVVGAGPRIAGAIRGAAEFGLPGAVHSNEQGVADTGLGAAIGTASTLSPLMKFGAATAIGAATGAHSYEQSQSIPKSVAVGLANFLMPLLGRSPKKLLREDGYALEEGVAHPPAVEPPAPVENFRLSNDEQLRLGLTDNLAMRNGYKNGQFEFDYSPTGEPLGPPRSMRPPPEGSLLRNPSLSEGEAMGQVRSRFIGPPQAEPPPLLISHEGIGTPTPVRPPTPPRPPEPARPPRPPEPPRPPQEIGAKAIQYRGRTFTGGTHDIAMAKLQRAFPDYKATTRAKDPIEFGFVDNKNKFVTKQEADAIYKSKMQKAIQEPVATLQPKGPPLPKERALPATVDAAPAGQKELTPPPTPKPPAKVRDATPPATEEVGTHIVGPAIVDKQGTLLASGLVGENHADLMTKAVQNPATFLHFLENFQDDTSHVFITNTGKIVDRQSGLDLARKSGQLKAEFADVPTLHSQYLMEKPVATLQKAEQSLPSSLEKPASVGRGLNAGDRAVAMIDGEKVVGTVHEGVEPNTIRFTEKDGTVHDLPPSKISKAGTKSPQRAEVESVGGLSDIEAAQQAARLEGGATALGGGGMMKRSNFGEHGSAELDTLLKVSKYLVAPVTGGFVGYAADDDHRLSSALEGAIILGVAAHFGAKAIAALAKGHPEVKLAGSFAEKLSKSAKATIEEGGNFYKAVKGDTQMAVQAETHGALATPLDRLAATLRKQFGFDINKVRMLGKAIGYVQVQANIMDKALRETVKGLAPADSVVVGRYFEGKLVDASLPFSLSNKDLAPIIIAAKQAKIALTETIIEGLGGVSNSKLANEMRKNLDTYLTRTFKIFNGAHVPTDEQINKAAQVLGEDWGTFGIRQDLVREYITKILQNRSVFGGLIRPSIRNRTTGESLDAVLTKKEILSPEFMDMLGMYTDPIDRMAATAVKLVNAARSAEYFNEVAKGVKANGLKYAYTSEELAATRSRYQTIADVSKNPSEVKEAIATLQELKGYSRTMHEQRFGRLSDMHVDLTVGHQLADFHNNTELFQTMAGKILAQTTNSIKWGKVVGNPLQILRQYIQAPILGAIGEVNPADIWTAGKLLWTKSDPAEIQRLTRLGVIGGDMVAGELRRDMRVLMQGKVGRLFDSTILGGAKAKVEEIFRTPDVAIRVATFLKKEAKLKMEYGSSSEAAARIEREAIDFTNRRTMNYAAMPPGVVFGRQLPFINQYLTFSYEIARLTKNLMQDALHGDMYALGVMSTMVTVPFLLQKMTEGRLSKKDREDWEKVKRLGPAYSRQNFKLVTGRKANGDFTYIDMTPLVPHESWLRTMKAVFSGDTEAIEAVNPIVGWDNTPVLTVASNFVTGRDRITGQRLDRFSWDMANTVRREVAPPPIGTEFDRVVDALKPNKDGGWGVINPRTGQGSTISQILQTYVTAMRPYTVKPDFLTHIAQAEARDQIAIVRQHYRRIAESNATDSAKNAAFVRAHYATDQIIAALQAKLGAPIPPQTVVP